MPITELTAEQKGLLAKQGINPDDYVYDDSTDEAVSVASLGTPSAGETLKESGKAFVRGASGGVSQPMEFAGRIGNLLSEIPGTDFFLGPGAKTTGPLGRLLEAKTEELAPRDRRMDNLGPVGGFIAEDVPNAVGQLATMLIPGTAATKLGPAGALIGRGAVGLMGAMGEGEQTADAEMARQRKAGEKPDELAATLKGAAIAPIAALLESKLGAGRLIEKLAGSKTGEKLVSKIIKNVATGGLEEGSQQLAQDLMVDHKIDLGNLVKPMLLGGLVQGGAGTAVDVGNHLFGNTQTETETPPSLDKAANFDVSGVDPTVPAEPQVDAPPVIDKPIGPSVTPAEMEAIMTIEKTGGEWTPANATDGDKAINTLLKNKVLLTPDIINEVYSLANNLSERGKEALNTRVREHSINAMVAKQMQPPKAGDLLAKESEQTKVLNKLTSDRLKQEKEIGKLETTLQDSTLTASARYLAQQKLEQFKKTLDDVDTEIASVLGADVKPNLGVQVAQRPKFFSAGPASRLDTEPSVNPDPEFGTEFKPQSAMHESAESIGQEAAEDAPLSAIPTTTFDTGVPSRAVALLPSIPGREGTSVPPQAPPPVEPLPPLDLSDERISAMSKATGIAKDRLIYLLQRERSLSEGEQSLPFTNRRE